MRKNTLSSERITGSVLLSLLLTFCLTSFSQNYQSYFWYMGDKQINMSNYASPNPLPIAGNPPHAKYVASGAYFTGNNNLPVTEFSVSDNFVHQYDPINGLVSQELFELNSNGSCGDGNCTGLPGSEIIAIPKPGSECGSYYIIWSSYNTSSSATFQKTATLGYSTYSTDLSLNNYTLNTCQIVNLPSNGQPFAPSFAVGKRLTNGNRYLYAVVPYYNPVSTDVTTRVYKYNITSTGIAQADLTPGLTNDYIEFQGVIAPSETELSFDQTRLAFARTNTSFYPNFALANAQDLIIIKLDASTGNLLAGSLGNVLTYNLPDHNINGDIYSGLEFTSDNLNLYINEVDVGVQKFTLSSATLSPSIVSSSNTYSRSQLELRYYPSGNNDQRICAVGNVGGTYEFAYINVFTNAMVANAGLSFTYGVGSTFSNVNGIYTLQDQVDGEDYRTWTSPNNSGACCTRFYIPKDDYPVTTTQTWSPGNNPFGNTSGDLYFKGTLTINPNVTLTINNMTVRFHPDSRVVISAANGQPSGGRLNLSNATLNGLNCGQTWGGVRILGNAAQAHLTTYQGYLNMNNSSIQNAELAISTWDGTNFSSSGGIAQVASSSFLNNRRDVEVVKYPSSGTFQTYTFFDLCSFIINNSYLFPTIDNRVTVSQYKDLRIKGCTFANDHTGLQTATLNTMIGVWGFDASFSIAQSSITPSIRSTFRNLLYGVRATRFFANEAYVVQRTDFNQNNMGILSEGVNNFVVQLQNSFNVGNNPNFTSKTGLFINAGSGFNVRDNTFTGIPATGVTNFGCVVRNTNLSVDADNSIYRNTFTNLNVANQAEGYNRRSGDAAGGLYYFCNNQSLNGYDIRVLPDNSYTNPWQGIKAVQGLTISGQQRSAQNTFSHTSQPQFSDLYNDPSSLVQNITYFWDAASPGSTTPTYSSPPPKVTLPIIGATTKNCASGDPYQFSLAEFNANGFDAASYEQAKLDYLNAKYIYNLLIDDGNKEFLKQSIDYAWSADAWQLRNNLLAKSPNLSEEILTYTARKNVLPPALLFEICLANIHSARRATFLEKLQSEFETTLPDYMVDILKHSEEPETNRKRIEEQYATANAQLSGTYQELFTHLLVDTNDHSELIIKLLEDVPLNSAKLSLIAAYSDNGRMSDAHNLINQLRAQNTSDIELNQELDITEFALSKGNNFSSLSQADISFIQEIANQPTHAGYVRANNLLRFLGLCKYNVQPLDLTSSSFKTSAPIKAQQLKNALISVYPNPASDYLTIDCEVYTNATVLTLTITDNTGKQLMREPVTIDKNHRILKNLPIENLENGNYLISVSEGNITLATSGFNKLN